jgi:hypothetical protein
MNYNVEELERIDVKKIQENLEYYLDRIVEEKIAFMITIDDIDKAVLIPYDEENYNVKGSEID